MARLMIVWNPEWTTGWHYRPNGRRTDINPRKHLIHCLGDTPAIDVGVYAYWKQRAVRLLRFDFTAGMRRFDGAIGLVAAFATFDLFKTPWDGGAEYGEQWVVPVDAACVWHPFRSAEDGEAVAAELLTLAYGAA